MDWFWTGFIWLWNQWQIHVNTIINFGLHKRRGICWLAMRNFSFSIRTVLHRISTLIWESCTLHEPPIPFFSTLLFLYVVFADRYDAEAILGHSHHLWRRGKKGDEYSEGREDGKCLVLYWNGTRSNVPGVRVFKLNYPQRIINTDNVIGLIILRHLNWYFLLCL